MYDKGMAPSDVAASIQLLDTSMQTRCHCGTKAKWIASIRLKGAQIIPVFQREDLCDDHAAQFAAKQNLEFPPSTGLPALKQTSKRR
jgi:hypothetical protein